MYGINVHMNPNKLYRFIFPVGQGGFAFEILNNTTVVYDCGSYTSQTLVEFYVDQLVYNQIDHIDFLFISHFDDDHVNGLTYLLNRVPRVCHALMPRIPDKYHYVYDVATGGAYDRTLSLLQEHHIEPFFINEDDPARRTGRAANGKDIWEWVGKAMMTQADWNLVEQKMQLKQIDMTRLQDAGYLNQHRADINDAFKAALGSKGPNAKGLIMVSHELVAVEAALSHSLSYWLYNLGGHDFAACLYTGDNNLKRNNLPSITQFLAQYKVAKLLLLQIPHHGSSSNSSRTLIRYLRSAFYFLCDKSSARFSKNRLFNLIGPIFVVRDVPSDIVITEVDFV